MSAPDIPRITTVFRNGGSQAVRIPAEYRFETDEVVIERVGDGLLLRPARRDWASFFADPRVAPDDFLADRPDEPPQEREAL